MIRSGSLVARASRVRWITCRSLWLVAGLAVACRGRERTPVVARVEPAFGGVFSVAAWGRDSTALRVAAERALAEVRRTDSGRGPDSAAAALDSLARAVRRRTGIREGIPLERATRGLALDRALAALRGGADSAILSLTGQYLIMARGERGVGISEPTNSLRPLAILTVPPGIWAVSTVSPVEEMDAPAGLARAVTVIAGDAAQAGVWSTAFYMAGCDRALAIAQQAGVGALCVDARVRWTPNLEGRVALASDSGRAASAPAPGRGPARAAAAAASDSTRPAANPDSSR